MSRDLNRRDLLLAGRVAGAGAMGRALGASQKATKKVLFFTHSSGFPHSVVTRDKEGHLALAEAHADRDRQGARF